ncbi:MAG: protease [Bacteroidetes bacterium GWA2_30_7]|nr:MAG: protease [Bacteroidetes bacterium GWA2_30_7]
MKKILLYVLVLLAFNNIYAQKDTRLLRFPAIHDNQIVFTYSGDLYTVTTSGGIARKLTSNEGFEMFAKFSPDGKEIAFTGQYEGNTEVYNIPSNGGTPKRLTFTATLGRDDISDRMGPNNIVMAWTNDGKNIVYRSRKKSFNDFVGQLFQVSINGGLSTELPLPAGGFCSYSQDGKKLAYNRVFREFRTWKYYKGGMADDVWIYNFDTKATENITNNISQDIFPMWTGNNIYYLSDRDRTMNMFVYDITSKETKKVTFFDNYDVKFPSINGNKIVFENGGNIYVFNTENNQYEKVTISISDDHIISGLQYKDASKNINSVSFSPDGNRLVIGARGDIFTVPVKNGITRNLTATSKAHDKNAVWSPDGKYIAYISDISGEFEIYIQEQKGNSAPIQLTKNADTYKFYIQWSPNSKNILFSDKMLRLQYVNIDSKEVTLVAQSKIWEINSFTWSPDGNWIAYSDEELNNFSMIYLYNLKAKEKFAVTDKWFDSYSPSFSKDGKYLYFASKRDFNPLYSETEWNHSYSDMANLYFITLSKDTKSPVFPENNEVTANQTPSSQASLPKNTNIDFSKNPLKIDKEGIISRIAKLPLTAGQYGNIYAFDSVVYYMSNQKGAKFALMMFDFASKKETKIIECEDYEISNDYKKMFISKEKKYYVVDVPKSEVKLEKEVNLSDMKIWVNVKDEWKQIYDESWRQMRDFFYVKNMHGLNWKAMHDKYAALLPFVNNRNDLNYIIGELIGELNIGHAYVGAGDKVAPERIKTGLLGAELSKHSSGYFKIERIYKGQNWDATLRSPLTEIGIKAEVGNYIIAVNGKPTNSVNDIYELLVGMADKQVELTINSQPSTQGNWNSIVIPIADESNLIYYNWVQKNIETVDKATNGEVGYIHIPDMVTEGLNEFVKYFYPQLDKKALIIDDRGNGGGNVSPMILERLGRELQRSNMARNISVPSQTPRQMILGPKVLLVNNYSASDGDLFPYGFKKYGYGKVIGMRTWGGVVGIRGSLPFIDGGMMTRPEFASYSADSSEWIIEGHGVDPDIVIDNDPAKEYAGEDQQLNKAIEVILEELKKTPVKLPEIPADPDKTK